MFHVYLYYLIVGNQRYMGYSAHKQSMEPEYEEIDEEGMIPNPVYVGIRKGTPVGIQHPTYILESWNGDLSQSSLQTNHETN